MDEREPRERLGIGRLAAATVVLGIGLGGFFDGIVLHELLQWHHMLSSAVPPDSVPNLELNTAADGVFHAATWVVTVVGVWMMLFTNGERHRASGRRILTGGLVAGWGGFNVVEGLIDHYVLQIHHVRPGPDQGAYDLAFLVWGAAFVILGSWLIRSASPRAPRSG